MRRLATNLIRYYRWVTSPEHATMRILNRLLMNGVKHIAYIKTKIVCL